MDYQAMFENFYRHFFPFCYFLSFVYGYSSAIECTLNTYILLTNLITIS